jgi:hypothetical protein
MWAFMYGHLDKFLLQSGFLARVLSQYGLLRYRLIL